MNNKIVYPITDELIKSILDINDDKKLYSINDIKKIAIETVKEYEHGTADVEDVEGVNIKQYASVVDDILRCIS